MKYLLEFILLTIILFFVWNILKRIFFSAFYKFPKENLKTPKKDGSEQKNKDKKNNKGLNWDAETIEYEEVKEEEKVKK